MTPPATPEPPPSDPGRRTLLGYLASAGMGGALLAAYGSLAAFFGRFLYPARPADQRWLYLLNVDSLTRGAARLVQLPDGRPVTITRRGESGGVDDFAALSSTCPHLGCRVHWEPHNNRFFCPCHSGVFTPEGEAVSGPPADAGQSLPRYPLKVAGGMLFIRAPLDALASAGRGGRDATRSA